MRRFLALLCLAAVAALAPAQAAWADGDPASDILLSEDIYLPYAPNRVSKPAEQALRTTVKRAREKGYELKLALIADPRDLGSVGRLFGKPQEYADLLTQELSLNVTHGRKVAGPRVLAVLPSGLGGNNLGDAAGDALTGVLPPEGAGPDELARTAAVAVGKLAAADGKPIALPELPRGDAARSGAGGGIPAPIAFGAPVLLLALVLIGVNARTNRHRRGADGPVAEHQRQPEDDPVAGPQRQPGDDPVAG